MFWRKKEQEDNDEAYITLENKLNKKVNESVFVKNMANIEADIGGLIKTLNALEKRLHAIEVLLSHQSERDSDAMALTKALKNVLKVGLDEDNYYLHGTVFESREKPAVSISKPMGKPNKNTKAKHK